MSKVNDGGAAFPETRWDDATRQEVQWTGMTLRDWFAGQALSGLAASGILRDLGACGYDGTIDTLEQATDKAIRQAAMYAYKQADAMIAAREATS